jgi:hypothetical protein
MYTGEYRPMTAKESWIRNSDEFSEQAMELVVRVFKESSGNFLLFFTYRRQPKHFKTICACTENNDLI